MSNRFAEIVILAEDERSANLLRRYVIRALHIGNRRIRQVISPAGYGDAKQWVLGRYAIEVKALRTKHAKTGLAVHLDADNETVTKRAAQLAGVLKDAAQDARAPNERIGHAIPRRQIETWLCALMGIVVDEIQDCKRQKRLSDYDAAVAPAALKLFELTRPNAAAPELSSLAAAVLELRRLEIE